MKVERAERSDSVRRWDSVEDGTVGMLLVAGRAGRCFTGWVGPVDSVSALLRLVSREKGVGRDCAFRSPWRY